MDRSRFSFKEVLKADVSSPGTNDDKLNLAFDRVEASANERQLDLHPYGIFSGLEVVENGTPNMTVKVNAGGADDQTGQRIEVPSQQSVDMTVDYQGNAIALPSGGQEKYASVFLKFKRLNQNSRQDANGVSYYQDELEYFEIRVRAGSSAPTGTATPPPLQGSEILLADVLLTPGMTQITTGDIELLDRRQDAYKLAPSNNDPKTVRRGRIKDVVTDLLQYINDIADGVLVLDDIGINHTNGSETFADSIAPPASGALRTWLRALITDLGRTSGTTGAARIGNSSLGTWADTTNAGSAGGIGGQLFNVIAALTSTTGARGAGKLTAPAVSGSPTSLTAGTIAEQISALLTAINARALAAFSPTGGISSTTVHTAIAELDADKAALAGATFTGEVRQLRANLGVQSVGVIAANTQITNDVGVVICQCPASNSANFNLAMPAPAAGNPLLFFKFYGGAGTGRRVWITTTAEINNSAPSNYFAYWDASVDHVAGALFAWDGTRWRHVTSSGLTGTAGGGTLAD